MTRSQPCLASACAIARPSPRLAPVTSAVLPRSLPAAILDFIAKKRLALNPVRSVVYQRQELRPGFLLVAEAAQHGRRDRRRVLLLHAAHHHAEVARLDHYTYPLWLN